MSDELLESVMGIIIYAGNAKSEAMEAIQEAKSGNFDLASEKMKSASLALAQAHQSQTSLLTKEAAGQSFEITLLVIHCQDHLMTSISFKELAEEIIDIHKKMANDS